MSPTHKLIVNEDIYSPATEAFRTLRTNIQFSKGWEQFKTIMFTSPGPGEGKSTIAANTAVTLAQVGNKVIILDCDLRKPVQHKIFRKREKGLTNALVDKISILHLIQDTGVNNLRLLASGPVPPNPAELLSSEAMQEIIEYLKAQADYVVIDTPPVIAVTDACVLASKVDGVNLVISAGTVRPEAAQKAKEMLLKVKANLFGVTLNRAELDKEEAYYYKYYSNDMKGARYKIPGC